MDRQQALKVLGLSAGATKEEVNKALKRLARKYHSDMHPHALEKEKSSLDEVMSEITAAAHYLSEQEKAPEKPPKSDFLSTLRTIHPEGPGRKPDEVHMAEKEEIKEPKGNGKRSGKNYWKSMTPYERMRHREEMEVGVKARPFFEELRKLDMKGKIRKDIGSSLVTCAKDIAQIRSSSEKKTHALKLLNCRPALALEAIAPFVEKLCEAGKDEKDAVFASTIRTLSKLTEFHDESLQDAYSRLIKLDGRIFWKVETYLEHLNNISVRYTGDDRLDQVFSCAIEIAKIDESEKKKISSLKACSLLQDLRFESIPQMIGRLCQAGTKHTDARFSAILENLTILCKLPCGSLHDGYLLISSLDNDMLKRFRFLAEYIQRSGLRVNTLEDLRCIKDAVPQMPRTDALQRRKISLFIDKENPIPSFAASLPKLADACSSKDGEKQLSLAERLAWNSQNGKDVWEIHSRLSEFDTQAMPDVRELVDKLNTNQFFLNAKALEKLEAVRILYQEIVVGMGERPAAILNYLHSVAPDRDSSPLAFARSASSFFSKTKEAGISSKDALDAARKDRVRSATRSAQKASDIPFGKPAPNAAGFLFPGDPRRVDAISKKLKEFSQNSQCIEEVKQRLLVRGGEELSGLNELISSFNWKPPFRGRSAKEKFDSIESIYDEVAIGMAVGTKPILKLFVIIDKFVSVSTSMQEVEDIVRIFFEKAKQYSADPLEAAISLRSFTSLKAVEESKGWTDEMKAAFQKLRGKHGGDFEKNMSPIISGFFEAHKA